MSAEIQVALSLRVKGAQDTASKPWFDLPTTGFTATQLYDSERPCANEDVALAFDIAAHTGIRRILVTITPASDDSDSTWLIESRWGDGSTTTAYRPRASATAPFFMVVSALMTITEDVVAQRLTQVRITRTDSGGGRPMLRVALLAD